MLGALWIHARPTLLSPVRPTGRKDHGDQPGPVQRSRTGWSHWPEYSRGAPFPDLATHPPLPPPALPRGPGGPRVSKHTSLQGEWDLPPTFSSAFPAGNDHWVRTGLRSKEVLIHIYICMLKSLQLCPTLCDPIDGSPRGSPVPGILQAKTLEWVASSFSNE